MENQNHDDNSLSIQNAMKYILELHEDDIESASRSSSVISKASYASEKENTSIDSVPSFSNFSNIINDDLLKKLDQYAMKKTLKRRDIIFRPKEKSNRIYLILQGEIALFHQLPKSLSEEYEDYENERGINIKKPSNVIPPPSHGF